MAHSFDIDFGNIPEMDNFDKQSRVISDMIFENKEKLTTMEFKEQMEFIGDARKAVKSLPVAKECIKTLLAKMAKERKEADERIADYEKQVEGYVKIMAECAGVWQKGVYDPKQAELIKTNNDYYNPDVEKEFKDSEEAYIHSNKMFTHVVGKQVVQFMVRTGASAFITILKKDEENKGKHLESLLIVGETNLLPMLSRLIHDSSPRNMRSKGWVTNSNCDLPEHMKKHAELIQNL